MYEVIPGILEKEWSEIERKIELVLPFAKTIHIDILDGKLFKNTTFLDPVPFKKYTDKIFFEVHMMVEDPIKYLKQWADAGFKRFIGHVERMPNQEEFVAQGQSLGEVGLAFDGPTNLEALKVSVEDLDNLLFMAIESGFSGRPFTIEYLNKVKKIREQSMTIPIEVDGGINDLTILQAKEIGVTRFAATSFIYKDNPGLQFEILNNLLNNSSQTTV